MESSDQPAPRFTKKIYNLQKDADQIFDLIHNGELSDLEGASSDEETENRDEVQNFGARKTPTIDEADENSDSEWEIDFEIVDDPSPNFTSKKNIKWRRRAALFSTKEFECHLTEDERDILDQPLEYFQKYLPDSLFETMAEQTNFYAILHNTSNFPPTTAEEIKTLFGLHILMSNFKLPRISMYWEPCAQIKIVSESMTRNRFYKLRNNLHLANDVDKPANCTDRLYKVRPIYNAVLSRCKSLEVEESLCVDEQMIPFKGHLCIKQYVKGKPCPWGIKNFVLCGRSGLAYNFVIYQGSTTELEEAKLKELGQGAAVVLHLAERIPINNNHKLYFDNFFTSYNLLELCDQKGISAAGTVRINRFAKPPLLSDAEMKKKGRGFSDEVVSRDDKIVLVKWQDNRTVTLASNFVGIGTTDKAKRWDKAEKKYIEIDRPEVVRLYNESMGGVDKMDFLIGLYRIFIRSRKWTLRLIMHAVDMALVNSWLEYKIKAEALGLPAKKTLDLLHFRFRVAEALIRAGKPSNVTQRKRGRPSNEGSPATPPSTRRVLVEVRPIPEVRLDMTDHMPEHTGGREATRCKFIGCTGKSRIQCEKCKVHLCLSKERNCFTKFHRDAKQKP